jgi:hypothetical protein
VDWAKERRGKDAKIRKGKYFFMAELSREETVFVQRRMRQDLWTIVGFEAKRKLGGKTRRLGSFGHPHRIASG